VLTAPRPGMLPPPPPATQQPGTPFNAQPPIIRLPGNGPGGDSEGSE
jgi:hypothetical protein